MLELKNKMTEEILIEEKTVKEIGSFPIQKGKPKTRIEKEKWHSKKIPLHFFLIFLILFFGTVKLISGKVFNKNLELASLVNIAGSDLKLDSSPQINNQSESQGELQAGKLPLINNRFYLFPLAEKIEIQKTSPEEPKKTEEPKKKIKKISRRQAVSSPKLFQTIKFSEEELKNGKYIEVDISEQTLRLYGSGELKGIYKVSTGKPATPTPIGNFRIFKKSANAWSQRGGLWMPYALEFTPGFFIHELPYWPGGQREGEGHLGQMVSSGCVRLGIGEAKEVYDFADIGTPLIIKK